MAIFRLQTEERYGQEIENDGICGDVWTWTAIDADTKLIPCFMVGQCDAIAARDFMLDLAGRLATRVQLASDGLKFIAKGQSCIWARHRLCDARENLWRNRF